MFCDPQFKKAIIGRKVKNVVSVDVGEENGWPGLLFDDGSCLVIQRDPEGNGPGFAVLQDKNGKDIGGIGE